ncbi:phage tail protein [Shewanella baltica]|uniref:phage tail protein n=1 Tax=Shewanella baltica TaxID=62322 RepID=UPI003D7AC74C
MNKPAQLRELLSSHVPHLQQNPDCLHVFIENGNIIATGAGQNLSFEYQFNCVLIVTDYAAHADTLIVPILGWLASQQPELLFNPDKRETGFKFKAEIINHTTADIEIVLALTERVKVVRGEGMQLEVTHLPEPVFNDEAIDWTLYTNGIEVPWPPTI